MGFGKVSDSLQIKFAVNWVTKWEGNEGEKGRLAVE